MLHDVLEASTSTSRHTFTFTFLDLSKRPGGLRARGAFARCQGDMAGKAEALSLYRRIMRTAQCWPSIKKEAVKTEIRDEFRRNMGEANPQKMAKMLDEARSGLQSLRQQCGMSSEGSDINYMYDDALQRRYKPPSR